LQGALQMFQGEAGRSQNFGGLLQELLSLAFVAEMLDGDARGAKDFRGLSEQGLQRFGRQIFGACAPPDRYWNCPPRKSSAFRDGLRSDGLRLS